MIALGESAPITPWLVAALQDIDRAVLTEGLAVGLAVAWQRVTNHAEARRGLAVNRVVACCPDSAEVPRELRAAGQLGAALGLGSGGTDTVIADAAQIAAVLPATQAAVLAGDLPWRKAASIAGRTLGLSAGQAGRVETMVIGSAWERSPARHDAAVRRAVDQVDPDRADRTRQDRDRDIRLVIDHNQSRHHGGPTIRTNLAPITRRWHRLKTFAGWTVTQATRGWEWTSPTGRTYTIQPHDYRLGP